MRIRVRHSTLRLYSVCLLSYALLIALLGPALVRRVEAARFPSARAGTLKVDTSIVANANDPGRELEHDRLLRFGFGELHDGKRSSRVASAPTPLSALSGSAKPLNFLPSFSQIPSQTPSPTSTLNPLPFSESGKPELSPPFPPEMLGVKRVDADFNVTPPSVTQGAPGSNLPNLDQLRAASPAQSSPVTTETEPPRAGKGIAPDLPCADCEGGGGGGGYYPPGDPRFSTARTRLVNQTGEQGVDLGSRNFNWGMPLVSLPGRAGLDLNLALFYNSLVWTRDGSYIKYNADLGTPAPGFRLGLPTMQQRFYNAQTGVYAYMMVTSSGGRVELRQVGATNTYESADSGYTQLTDNSSSLVVRTSDGTQLTFTATNDVTTLGYRCTQIKDRNGNYISAAYDLSTSTRQS